MNWLLYAILGVAMLGVSPVFAKSGMHKSNVHLAASLRGTMLLVSAVFMINLTGSGVNLMALGHTALLYLFFSGLATGMTWVCLLRALQYGEVIKVVPIVLGSEICNLLIGMIVFREAVTWNKIIIMVLLIAGVFMMSIKNSGRRSRGGAWVGYALAAMGLTTVAYVLERIGGVSGNVYGERMIMRYGVAVLVVWILTFATGGYKGLRAMSFLDGTYLCLSGLTLGASWFCIYQANLLGPNNAVAMIGSFEILAAVAFGCVFMRERMSVRAIFGMIFLIAGFLLQQIPLPVIPV